ncbi:MAG: sugar ABC transporter substrate-binding protein [Mycobacteriales bacterium]
MTRSATVLVAAAALGLVAGCGSGSAKQVSESSKQTLTVWAMGAEGEKLGTLAKDFEAKNANISVKVTPISWDVAHQKLVTAIAGGKTPDLSQLGTTWMGEFAGLGALDEVKVNGINKSDYFSGIWDSNVVDGKTVGMPWYVETRVLFYRTDLAQKAGITGAPTTWTELRAAAQKYKQHSQYGISLQPGGAGAWQTFAPFVWQDGGELVSNGKLTADSPQVKEAFTEYGWYFKQGLAAKSIPPGFDVTKAFADGSQPMFFSGPWSVGILNDTHPELKGKWAIAPMPSKQTATSFVGGSNMGLFKKSAHKAAAEKFLAFLGQPETQAKFYGLVKDLPANKAAWQQGPLAGDANMKVFGKQLDDAKSPPALPHWEELSAKLDSWIEKVARGDASADQAAAGFQRDGEPLVGK